MPHPEAQVHLTEALEALQWLSSLFPKSLRDDGTGKVGFRRESIRKVEAARRVLRRHGLRPAHIPEDLLAQPHWLSR